MPRKNREEYNAYMRGYMRERAAKRARPEPAPRPISCEPQHTPLMTTQQAAAYLQVSVSWLQDQRWLQKGPPYIKLGRSVRYDVEELRAWLREREQRGQLYA